MKNTILLSLTLLVSFSGASQAICNADFTSSTSRFSVNFTNTSTGTIQYFWDWGWEHVYIDKPSSLLCN